jgi:hypothetical protein
MDAVIADNHGIEAAESKGLRIMFDRGFVKRRPTLVRKG